MRFGLNRMLLGKLDGKWYFSSGTRLPGRGEWSSLVALDPQLVCYSWITGVPELAQSGFRTNKDCLKFST